MSTVPEIEEAIRTLSAADLAEFRNWFAEYDAENWDQQFDADVAGGRLDALGEEALEDFQAGRCTEL